MKKKLLILMILVFAKLTNGQSVGTFNVNIKDTKDSALCNVEIEILNEDSFSVRKLKSDLNGKAQIDSLSENDYIIKVSLHNFSTKFVPQPIKVGEITFVCITLETLSETEVQLRKENTCLYNMSIKKPICHLCKQKKNVIPYSYGLPNKKVVDASVKGNFKLGGCLIKPCRPFWFCNYDKTDVLKQN